MALRTAEEYINSLRDGRIVYYAGERVADVTVHPDLRLKVSENARQFGKGGGEAASTLAGRTIVRSDGVRVRRWAVPPRTHDDLLKFIGMEEGMEGDLHGAVTAGLTGLAILARKMDAKHGTSYTERIDSYNDWFATNDLHGAFAMTDAKGDRSKSPSAQADPDLWLRVVERRADGVVIRGAKTSVTSAAFANELLVLPTHGMSPADKDWSIACAVPANAPGVEMISNFAGSPWGNRFQFDRPVSHSRIHHDATVVFNDVFVPNERIFMDGEHEFTRELLYYFTTLHRTGILVKEPRETKKLIGAALLMARYNGLEDAGAIKGKIAEMIETARLLETMRYAALNKVTFVEGVCVPDAVACNLAGLTVTRTRQDFLTFLCELTGGAVLTAPSGLDLANPATSAAVRKYYVGKAGVSAEVRLALIKYIYDIAASDFAGFDRALGVTAAGSPSARRLAVTRGFDGAFCEGLVLSDLSRVGVSASPAPKEPVELG